MIVTEQTLYADFAPYLPFIDKEQKERLMQAAERKYGACNMLTIDQFFGLLDGNYELLGDMSNPSVFQGMWIERFRAFCEAFAAQCEQLTITPTQKQTRAQQGIKPLDHKASMLVFVRDYFGLHSFAACGSIMLGEYLTARQDRYNAQVMQRNMQRIQEQDLKKNSRR